MGDTIAMDELLVEFIEGQVRIVEGRRAAVPERWGEQLQQPASQAAPNGDSLHTSGVPPQEPQWQGSSSSSSSRGVDANERQAVWSDTFASVQEPAGGSSAGPSSSSSSSSGTAGRSAWSDDLASVLVVDYRASQEAAAGGSAGGSAVPVEPAAGLRSGVVGSSFDMGDAAGASSGEDDWGSHLSGCSGMRIDSDSGDEGGSSSGVNGDIAIASNGIGEGHRHSSADAAQPLYEEALERRLSRMEEQLQHITTLLEGQPPAQQAQQAQQPPSWQSAMFEPQARRRVGFGVGGGGRVGRRRELQLRCACLLACM